MNNVQLLLTQRESGVSLSTEKRGRIPGLDGLRTIAVMVVFVSHYITAVLPSMPKLHDLFPGMLGVTLFFVLSGFLISTLLSREYESTRSINVRDFYVRRLLRLTPALYAYVTLTLLAYLLFDGSVVVADFVSAVTYTSNYYQLFAKTALYYMPVWSLAIEEHFYLLFPALMFWCLRDRKVGLLTAVALGIVAISLWRFYVATRPGMDWHQIYVRTDTRLDSILYGVLLMCVAAKMGAEWTRDKLGSYYTLAAGVAILAISVVYRGELFRMSWRYNLQGVALLLIIGFIVFSQTALGKFSRTTLDSAPMRYISDRSYSLYLYHLTLLKLAEHVSGGLTPRDALMCALGSFVLAHLSYRHVEQPFLGLRRRFGSHEEEPLAVQLSRAA